MNKQRNCLNKTEKGGHRLVFRKTEPDTKYLVYITLKNIINIFVSLSILINIFKFKIN